MVKQINRMPVKTWNWLKMNEASIEVPDGVDSQDDIVIHADGTGEKTETVTTANWVKTIKTNLPASFSFSRKVTKKEGVTIDDNGVYSYVNAHLFHYEVFTADGVRIKEADAGGTGTPKDMKGQKFNFTITEGHLNASYSYSIDKDGKLPQTDPGK